MATEASVMCRALVTAVVSLWSVGVSAQTTVAERSYEPRVGQPGKDVVWVPTPEALVEEMLDLANVTSKDYVIDLGSGDGRTVIAAVNRGARARGVEYNADMLELSRRNAEEAGVGNRATFAEADLFETDLSHATVITMFLLPSINEKLRPKILDLKPGTRIVSNTFGMSDWTADETVKIPECENWCTALLWIVPARVDGTWRLRDGTLTIEQSFQMISGRVGSTPITAGRLRGNEISFTAGTATYTGRVDGNSMLGTVTGGPGGAWTATRQ